MDQFLTYSLDQFLTYKTPNLGPIFNFTAHIYIYGCNLSGWADLGQKTQKSPILQSKMAMKHPHLKGGGFSCFNVSSSSLSLPASALVFLLSLCFLTFLRQKKAHPIQHIFQSKNLQKKMAFLEVIIWSKLEVIIWSKFGPFGSYYLVQVWPFWKLLSGPSLLFFLKH